MSLAFKHDGVKKQSASLFGLKGGIKKGATSAYAMVGGTKELLFLPDIIFPDGTETYVEYFADEVGLGTVGAGVTLQTHQPVLYTDGADPLAGWVMGYTDNNIYDPDTKALVREMSVPTWDERLNWGSIHKRPDGIYEWFYMGMLNINDINYYQVCLAYSEDGVIFWKPNIGRVSYDGSTQNNIVFDGSSLAKNASFVFYDENPSHPDYKYVLLVRPISIGQIYTSPDPVTTGWTWRSETGLGGEIKYIHKAGDGDFVVWYKTSDDEYLDGPGRCYLTIAPDVTGPWSARLEPAAIGTVLYDAETHHYAASHCGAGFPLSGSNLELALYGWADRPRFDDRLADCWTIWNKMGITRDKYQTITEKDAEWWLPRWEYTADVGSETEPGDVSDSHCLFSIKPPVREGTKWRFYSNSISWCYGQQGPPFGLEMAEVDFRRIFSAQGTGEIVSGILSTGGKLYLNKSGTVAVELLDSFDTVITGYEQANCDSMVNSGFFVPVKWGGNDALPSGDFKIKLYLSDANIYNFAIYTGA